MESQQRMKSQRKRIRVLASKEKGGLGVSSFYALNRALLFKWVWRFCTQRSSLWVRVIKGIHGKDGKLGNEVKHSHRSIWLDIFREMEQLKNHVKISHKNVRYSLRRILKGGVEHVQFLELLESMEGVTLVDMRGWLWSLKGSGEFFVASVRRVIDECWLPEVSNKTRWINVVPIKVKVHA
nr:RNA-directed DNA polymerase, eukaryota, reverse transcriptase zinc-binding domain protein [Tanacetum cinerariifolium]